MKKFFYVSLLLMLIIFDTVKSYEHWIREDWKLLPVIYVNGNKLTSSYCDFFFLDSVTALMSKSGGVQGANIFKTTDGGYSWNYVLNETIIWKDGHHEYVPARPSSFNVKNGIAVLATRNQTTALKTFSKDSGMVWISLDTGKTWEKNFTGLKSGINDVKILDNGTIVVLSDSHIAISDDVGKTWIKSIEFPKSIYDTTTIVNPTDSSKNIMTYWSPNFIEYQDENNFYVFAISNYFPQINNRMIFTSDGGHSWNYKEFTRKEISDFAITSDKKLWITGGYKRNDTGMTYIYVDYSTDNGDTWKNSLDTVFPERWSNYPVSRIKFYDSLNGAIVGNFGTFMRTADGGKTWHDEVRKGIKPDTMIYGSFSNLEYKTKDTIVLYDFGNLFNARLILAPLLELPTNVAEIRNFNDVIQLYPNPASDFIELSINNETNPNASFAQIFNIFGIEVSKSSLTDGNNRINISHLPAGVYYIRIGDKTEKFVKM